MALNLGDDVIFEGPALPEAFVRHELEKQLGPALPKEKAVGTLYRLAPPGVVPLSSQNVPGPIW